MTVVQYCDNIKTNKEYNFISGTFIINLEIALNSTGGNQLALQKYVTNLSKPTYSNVFKSIHDSVHPCSNTVEWLC